MIRISGEPPESPGGPMAELFRLQTDFQARLADETLRYLRSLQTVLGPAAPGTIVVPEADALLQAEGGPGETVSIHVDVQNLQQVHCVVTPMVSPLVNATGVTWFAEAEVRPAYLLVPPGRTAAAELRLAVPAALPAGDYRGALLLHGGREGIPVLVRVRAATAPDRPKRKAAPR
jgi:hypothetical protein